MKKFLMLLVLMFSFLYVNTSFASVEYAYTGNMAMSFAGLDGYPGGPYQSCFGMGDIPCTGFVIQSGEGLMSEFEVFSDFTIVGLYGSASTSYVEPDQFPAGIGLSIFKGTNPNPEAGGPHSIPIELIFYGGAHLDKFGNGYVGGLNIPVSPGKYWSGVHAGTRGLYVGDSGIDGSSVVPEPATYLLFGVSLLVMFWNKFIYRRKSV